MERERAGANTGNWVSVGLLLNLSICPSHSHSPPLSLHLLRLEETRIYLYTAPFPLFPLPVLPRGSFSSGPLGIRNKAKGIANPSLLTGCVNIRNVHDKV